MNEPTQNCSNLQAVSVNNAEKTRLPKVTYEFTAVPRGVLRRIKSHLHAVYLALVEFARRGVWDPAIRWIVAHTGKSERQVKRDLKQLCALGLIERTFRRLSGDRNDTNIYDIPAIRVGVMDGTEKQERKSLKTTTPVKCDGPKSPPEKSDLQKLHEARFAQDRADSKWRREQYERRASFWDTMKGWAEHRIEQRLRRQAETIVGYNPTPAPTPEQEAEYQAMRDRADAERVARVMAEQEGEARRRREAQEEREAWIRRAYGRI